MSIFAFTKILGDIHNWFHMLARNYSIDNLKILCALLIVFLHTGFEFHNHILPVTRCAVPCFFMISGYLLFNGQSVGVERLKRGIRHILGIMIWATVLYAVCKETDSALDGTYYLPSWTDLLNFVVFNENPFGYHLWYLGAYLYVLFIALLADRYSKWKYLFYAIPVLLSCNLILSHALPVETYSHFYIRNFLFEGLPYFSLGAFLKTERCAWLFRISHVKWFWLCVLFAVTSELENLETGVLKEHFVSTIFLSVSLFVLMVSFKQDRPTLISSLGAKYSLYIYVFHLLFLIYFFPYLNTYLSDTWNTIYGYGAPLIIFVATILFTYLLYRVRIIR